MKIQFTKMQGLGNDFVIIDGITHHPDLSLNREQIQQITDRHFGVGCDQLLWIQANSDKQADFSFRIFNTDGSESGQCGNGARCIARYVYDHGLTTKKTIKLATPTNQMVATLEDDGQVTVDMGVPQFNLQFPFTLDEKHIGLGLADLGNPHAVLQVNDIVTAKVERWGAALEKHPHFPAGVNTGFMEVIDKKQIKLRVFERGVGETLACGSGACAAVVLGHAQNILEEKVTVDLPGGRLLIEWNGTNTPIKMTGPAATVFVGYLQS